ncbi:MAG: uridine kinase [Acidobacteria bacterium]|nr:uridine kinase [Acidobacteriota bacterium]
MKPARNVLIGITGGTGSGKTTIAREVCRTLGSETAVLLEQDSYYLDLEHLPFEQRSLANFDHPSAFDWGLLVEQVSDLLAGRAILRLVYDFHSHLRTRETVRVEPRRVTVLEGILILGNEALRNLMDLRVYVATDADIRLLRRIQRDIRERGRTLESVAEQYLTTVRPMHARFVEPSREYADIVIPEGGHNRRAIASLVAGIRALL